MYNGKNRYYLLGHLDRTKYYVKSGQVYPGQIVGYVGNTRHCSSSACGEIRDDVNRTFRNQGYGAHLHLQMYLSDIADQMDFLKSIGIDGTKCNIVIKKINICNSFDYEQNYFW